MSLADPTSIRLRFRGTDVFLGQGQYLIGRSASCQLVIDHPRVSRRHARLVVQATSVTLEDLGSANGVLVNGQRLTAPHLLSSGDRFVIGGELLQLHIESGQPVGEGRQTEVSLPAVSPAPPNAEWEATNSGAGTQRAEVFELVGRIADRALAEGRPEEAESVLRGHLTKVLEQARRGVAPQDRTRQTALHYALELALASGEGRWLEYAIELLTALGMVIPEALAREIQDALTKVSPVNTAKLDAYAGCIERLPDGVEKSRGRARLNALKRAAATRR